MFEVERMINKAEHRMMMLEPLVEAEEAANQPPTPESHQAAYEAVSQWHSILLNEKHRIFNRICKLACSLPGGPCAGTSASACACVHCMRIRQPVAASLHGPDACSCWSCT